MLLSFFETYLKPVGEVSVIGESNRASYWVRSWVPFNMPPLVSRKQEVRGYYGFHVSVIAALSPSSLSVAGYHLQHLAN